MYKKHGIPVHYLSTSKKKIITTKEYSGFYWNPETGEIDLRCFEGVTAVINLAGATIAQRWTKTNKEQILKSRTQSLRTLHNALSSIDGGMVQSFVSASAIGIYPNSISALYAEDNPEVDASFLGDVVAAWEQEIQRFNSFLFHVATVRIGLVMSTEGGALPEMAKPISYGLGAAFGSGKQWQSWIHIHDLSRLFFFVQQQELSGVFNGVAPNPVTNYKLVKEIAKQLKKPLFMPNIPRVVMRLILGEMSYLLFASQRVSCSKILEEGFQFKYSNVTAALQKLYPKE